MGVVGEFDRSVEISDAIDFEQWPEVFFIGYALGMSEVDDAGADKRFAFFKALHLKQEFTAKIYEEIIQLMEKTAGYCKLVGCMAINKNYFK